MADELTPAGLIEALARGLFAFVKEVEQGIEVPDTMIEPTYMALRLACRSLPRREALTMLRWLNRETPREGTEKEWLDGY